MINAQAGPAPRILVFGFLLAGMLLAGCRTYGRYDNPEKTLEQIQRSNERFSEELQRARRDLNLLTDAAQGDSSLRAYAEQYRQLLLAHEALLDENRELQQRLEGGASYRELHRVFHAILSEERIIRNQYASLHEALARQDSEGVAASDTFATVDPRFTGGRYVYIPVFYERLRHARQALSMREALRRQGTGGEAPELLPGGEEAPASGTDAGA